VVAPNTTTTTTVAPTTTTAAPVVYQQIGNGNTLGIVISSPTTTSGAAASTTAAPTTIIGPTTTVASGAAQQPAFSAGGQAVPTTTTVANPTSPNQPDNSVTTTTTDPKEIVVNGPITSVKETNGKKTATFFMTLTNKSPLAVAVRWRTVGGTAKPGFDYVETRGTAVIPVGSQKAAIKVTIIGDSHPAPPETFSIELLSATGAKIGAKGTITIIDND
jgi:hypothetical protein